jgi:hypothetical protein
MRTRPSGRRTAKWLILGEGIEPVEEKVPA